MKRVLGYPRRNIRIKLFTSYVLITLPLLVLALYFAHEWSLQQRSLLTANAREGAMDTALRLGTFFDRTGLTLSAIARHPTIQSGDPPQMAGVLNSLLPVLPRFSSISVVSLDGKVLISAPEPNQFDVRVSDQDYFHAIASGMPIAVSGALPPGEPEAGSPSGFVVAVPVKDEDGRPIRVLMAGIQAHEIQQDLLPTLDPAKSSVLVLDQYDRIVFYSQLMQSGSQISLPPIGRTGNGGEDAFATLVTDPLSGRVSPARVWPVSGNSGWSVVAIERMGALQTDDTQRKIWVTLLALLALALSAGCAIVLGGRISHRVTQLSRAAALVAGGELGAQVPVSGRDETTVLSQTFNTMSARLAEMVRQLGETRRSLQQSYAEVGQALTAGFEPEKTLELILRVVMSRLNVPAALVGRVDEEGRYLHWVAVAGPLEHKLAEPLVSMDSALSPAARAVVSNAVVRADDPTMLLANDNADDALERGNPSSLVAPLRVGGKVTGVIQVLDQGGRSFDDEEIDILLAFAESASLALDKAALFAKTERQKLFMQSVLDSIPIAVSVVHVPTYTHELVNPMYRSMIGTGSDEQAQQISLDLQPSPAAAALRASAQAAYETGVMQRLEDVAGAPRHDGRVSRWATTCSPLPDVVGCPDWILITGVETTEYVAARREIESLARIAEHRAHELETVISSMTDGVMVVDRKGHLLMVNEAARQILGGTEDILRVEDAHRLRIPRYPSGQPIPIDQMPRLRAARGEHFSDTEIIVHAPNGADQWLNVSGAPLLDRDGQPRGGVCVFHDATEQRRRGARQRLLAEVSQLFNSSMDLDEVLHLVANRTANALGDWCAIHLLDESRQCLRPRAIHHPDPGLAKRAERLLGGRLIQLDELRAGRVILDGGPVLIEKFEPDDLRHFARSMRRLARSKDEVVTSFLAVPLRARGRVLGAMSVTCTTAGRRLTGEDLTLAVDLAERAALALDNARLYQQTEGERLRLQSIVDSLPEGIIIAEGDDGRVTTANRVAESMWGGAIPPGTRLADLSTALAASKADAGNSQRPVDLLNTIATGETMLSYEATIRRPDGSSIDVLASSAPYWYRSDKGAGMVAVFQDISRIKGIERLKDEFLSITSHELRTPLTSLKGFAQFLLRRAQRAPGRDADLQALEVINRQINRMVDLVGDLLDVSRIEAGQVILSRQAVDLVALVRRTVQQTQVTARQHRLKVEAVESTLQGWWDERRIEQVMMNLLDNAVKYSPAGPVEIAIRRWDDEAVVSIRDYGAGLSKENQDYVFQRFYRGGNITTRSNSGLGLGLYICDQLVRYHGGRMWVDSEEGQGATFWFALPIVAEDDRCSGGEEDGEYAESIDCRR